MTEKDLESYRAGYEALMQFGARYRADEALRARIENGDYGGLYGKVPEGAAVRVVCQTPEVYYMPMPEDPNASVSDQQLASVVGGSACIAALSASLLTSGSVASSISSSSSVGTASTNNVAN